MAGRAPSSVPASRAAALAALLLLPLASACGPSIDVKQAITITDISGGYYDAGVKDGKNKLVPGVTFRVRKNTDASVRPLSLNIAFKTITPSGEQDFDDVFVQSVDFTEGNQTAPITIRTETGYTADPPQSRADMLKNSHFQDLRVVIFAKHSSSNWVEIARYDLPRTLILP
jgi:hypothetical protein